MMGLTSSSSASSEEAQVRLALKWLENYGKRQYALQTCNCENRNQTQLECNSKSKVIITSPYGSISQYRMLAIRIGMSSGCVSSLVSHTSNSTSMLSVSDRTSGCGHVRMCTRRSSGASHLGQWSCIHCLWQRITMPVTVSTWRWIFEIGKMLVYGLWQYWAKQLTHAEY